MRDFDWRSGCGQRPRPLGHIRLNGATREGRVLSRNRPFEAFRHEAFLPAQKQVFRCRSADVSLVPTPSADRRTIWRADSFSRDCCGSGHGFAGGGHDSGQRGLFRCACPRSHAGGGGRSKPDAPRITHVDLSHSPRPRAALGAGGVQANHAFRGHFYPKHPGMSDFNAAPGLAASIRTSQTRDLNFRRHPAMINARQTLLKGQPTGFLKLSGPRTGHSQLMYMTISRNAPA